MKKWLLIAALLCAGCGKNDNDGITQVPPPPPVGQDGRLAFVVQPGAATVGEPITPAVEVEVLDSLGQRDRTATDSIRIAVVGDSTSETLTGTVWTRATAGIARFDNLILKQARSDARLSASAANRALAVSEPFDVTASAVAQVSNP